MDRRLLGQIGEDIAEKYLIGLGYEILAKNYRSKFGEVDLVALDWQTIVFVEVKARTSCIFGEPEEAVNKKKISKIIKTALYFLNSAIEKNSFSWRVDVVAVKLGAAKKLIGIKHFKNILNGT
jgi:putative endonuclease